jgi:hypothetical protein
VPVRGLSHQRHVMNGFKDRMENASVEHFDQFGGFLSAPGPYVRSERLVDGGIASAGEIACAKASRDNRNPINSLNVGRQPSYMLD